MTGVENNCLFVLIILIMVTGFGAAGTPRIHQGRNRFDRFNFVNYDFPTIN
jgi:hypothetical protein